MANVLDRDFVVSAFKLQSHYYVFRTNILGKGIEPPYPSIVLLLFYKEYFGIR